MAIIIAFILLITFMGTQYPMPDIPKGEVVMYDQLPGSTLLIKQNIRPFSEFKDDRIVKQEFDYSCGSAAFATLLNFYLGESFNEQQVIQGLMQNGDANMIQQRRAFSLFDMKRFAEVLGYKAAGYKADIEDLRKLDKPAIVPIEFYGYKHFVVYRGIYKNHVFVADPFMGNMSYTLDRFIEIWNQNIVFIVSDEAVKMNALALKNEDLRLIDFDITKDAVKEIPEDYIRARREVISANRKMKILTLNIK